MEQAAPGVDKSVNKVEESNPKNQARPCYRCGKDGHAPTVCRFKEVTCHNCGNLGHLKAVCRRERKQPSGRKTKPPIRSSRRECITWKASCRLRVEFGRLPLVSRHGFCEIWNQTVATIGGGDTDQ